MERDKIIDECRQVTRRLNELHKALSELGVIVEVESGSQFIRYNGVNRVQEVCISVSYTQAL